MALILPTPHLDINWGLQLAIFIPLKNLVTQLCLTLCDPMDCSLPGSSVHGIFQARILEWIAISFSRGSSQPRDQTQVSHIVGRFFTIWATREGQGRWRNMQIHDYWVACSGSGDSEKPHTVSLLANVDWVLTEFQVLLGSGAYVFSSLIKEQFGDE